MNKIFYMPAMILLIAFSTARASIKNLSEAEAVIQKSLNKFCVECHDEDLDEGDVRLDNFSKLSENLKFEMLNKIEEQVYLKLMPPKEKKKQPTEADRKIWLGDIKSWYENSQKKSTFRDKVSKPQFGNYVEHEKLFSGEFKDLKPFTYNRQWMVSEYIFKEKINKLLNNNTAKIRGTKEYKLRGLTLPDGIVNPFKLPTNPGVRYYANEVLSSSHFVSLLDNAGNIADLMIAQADKSYLPAINEITEMSDRQNQVLHDRIKFLNMHIHQVCDDLYSDNESWLPKYQPVKIKGEIGEMKKAIGRRDGKMNTNTPEGMIVASGLKNKLTPEQIIRNLERYWAHWGYNKDFIERNVEYYRFRWRVLLKKNKYKNLDTRYSPLKNKEEMDVVNSAIKKFRQKGITYEALIAKCKNHWQEQFRKIRQNSDTIDRQLTVSLIEQLYDKIFERRPDSQEIEKTSSLFKYYREKVSDRTAVKRLIETLLMKPEFVLRNETGAGKPDEYGRRMLSPRDASYAIAYALTDHSPDKELRKAAKEGRLNTKEDYKREIKRLLNKRENVKLVDTKLLGAGNTSTTTPIRKLRFFREFFGYDKALEVFKDHQRFGNVLGSSRKRLIIEADLLVDHIINKDKDVFNELLTTDKFYTYHNGDNQDVIQVSQRISDAYNYFTKNNWLNFRSEKDLLKHKEYLKKNGFPGYTGNKIVPYDMLINLMSYFTRRMRGGKKYIMPMSTVTYTDIDISSKLPFKDTPSKLGGSHLTNVVYYYNIDPLNWDYPPKQPAKLPNRMGILTHPAWLQAFSQNDHTDPVKRGKWIQEKLLAGTIPDVPINVEAVIPKDPTRTLRDRLHSATSKNECWRCHKYMNPLGNAFEMYDDFGRFRTKENLEDEKNIIGKRPIKVDKRKIKEKDPVHPHETFPGKNPGKGSAIIFKKAVVDTTGVLKGTGNSKLDGPVKDAHDMIQRLSKADRVRQSIIRYAFRYFMGRNEMLSDSKTLIEADEAYVKSGGSFDAVIVSLLTSDSFIYRKERKE